MKTELREPKGSCYQQTIDFYFKDTFPMEGSREFNDDQRWEEFENAGFEIKEALLVHGKPKPNQGHAWLEITKRGETFCVDASTKPVTVMPKKIYYALGKIKESENVVYTLEETQKNILKHGHYGPWKQ